MCRGRYSLALALTVGVLGSGCGSFKDDGGDNGGAPDGFAGDAPGIDAGDASLASEGGDASVASEGGNDAATEGGNGGRPCTAAMCPPVVMADDLHYPVAIALDATYLYWIEAGNGVSDPDTPMVRIAKSMPCLKSTDPCRGVLDSMAGGDVYLSLTLAVGPDEACYTQTYDSPAEHSVYCVAFGSGGKRVVYEGTGAATQIVATADTIAWADFGQTASSSQGAVFAVPADAGFTADAQALASARPGPTGLAADGPAFVWVEDGTSADAGAAQGVSPDGGPPTLIAGGQQSPSSVVAYGGYAYWTSLGDGTVRRMKDDGTGTVDTLASGETLPVAIAADASGVYWVNAGTGPDYLDGALRRVDLAGGTVTTMMPGIVNALALAIDDADVYVCNAGTTGQQFHDGTIWQMAKTY
jgi:hypothetical protein